jgi:hypothetical protein
MLLCGLYWYSQTRTLRLIDGVFPYTGTTLTPYGAWGEENLGERPISLGWPCRLLLTVLGCAGGALVLGHAMPWIMRQRRPGALLLLAAWQVPFILVAPALWDRYLLPVVPAALYLAAARQPRSDRADEPALRLLPGLAMVLLFGAGSVALMHDWLAYNSASWELGRRALAQHVNPVQIEGGLAWDGWFYVQTEEPRRRTWQEIFVDIAKKAGGPRGLTLHTTRVWFPRVTGQFALSFTKLPGSTVVDSEPYSLWVVPGERHFLLLKAASGPEGAPEQRPPSSARKP